MKWLVKRTLKRCSGLIIIAINRGIMRLDLSHDIRSEIMDVVVTAIEDVIESI